MANQMNKQSRGSSPLDNLAYDLITIIQNKAQALEAYDKYMNDAQGNEQIRQSLEKIRQQDQECINDLCEQLGSLLGSTGQRDAGKAGGQTGMAGSSAAGSRR